MPLREVGKGLWEGPWSQRHIARGCDFTGLKVRAWAEVRWRQWETGRGERG